MDDSVVIEAKKHLDTVDFVVDLYDNRFVWASEEVLQLGGYSLEEFTKLRNLDTLDKSVDQTEIRRKMTEDLAKRHGTTTVLCNTKAGQKVRLHFEYQIIELNGGWFMAGKTLNVEKLP